jgi:PAS domain S-box-containing protein
MAKNATLVSDFRGFFEVSADLMVIIAPQGNIVDVNQAWYVILGLDRDNLIDSPYLDLIHPEDRANTQAHFVGLIDGSESKVLGHETRVRCSNGTYRWTEWTAGRLDDAVYAIGRDITARKVGIDVLNESIDTTRAIFDAAMDSIVVIDRDFNIVDTNEASERIHGHPSDVRRSHSVLDLIHPDDQDLTTTTLQHAFDGDEITGMNFRIRHADGSYVMLEARGRALHNDSRPPNRLVFIARDRTKAVEAAAALSESLETTRAIFDAAVDGIVMINRKFEIVESNAASKPLFGRSSHQRIGESSFDLVHPDDQASLRESAQRLFTSGEIVTARYRVQHEDGHWVMLESRGRALHNADGPPTLAVFIARDISKAVEAEEALAANVATTRAILHAAPDSIIMINHDLIVLDASPATQRIYGLTPSERFGASALNVVHPDDRANVERALRRFFDVDERDLFSIRFRAAHADGHVLFIEARGLLLRDSSGATPRAVIVSRDVTESVIAEAALADSFAKTGAILEAVPESIVTIDGDLRVLDSSPGSERLYGITQEDRRGRAVFDLVHPDDQTEIVAGLRRLFEADDDEMMTYRFRAVHGDDWIKVETRGRLLRRVDGQPPQAVLVSRDITEEFLAQEALKAAKETAEQANLAKSEFMSRMSHELRTPLNSVLGFAQILEMELESEDQLELVSHIYKSGNHLLELINEVLDISRVESGHISVSLEAVSMSDIIAECVRIISPLAADSGVTVIINDSDDVTVLADAQRLTQVVINLMSNAVKFNRPNGRVTIDRVVLGDRLRLSVIDTGPGIEPAMQSRLFTAFDRLDADMKGIEGTGLGLALSKSLIEALGGTIGVDSTPGVGSTFWIELPISDEPRSEPQLIAPRVSRVALPDATVLYIEDNVANVHLVERLLAKRSNVHLVTSLQGGLGIELAQQIRPALILLDVHLPDLHGLDVLKRLRSTLRTADIPVIILSADATEWQNGRFLEAGANDYLTKPFNLHRLIDVLNDYLGDPAQP